MCPISRPRLPDAIRFTIALSLLALALAPAVAQQDSASPAQAAAEMGRIHGRVINPQGEPQNGGTVSLSTDGGATLSYNFPVSPTGEYSGHASSGEYMVIYRTADAPEGKVNDYIQGVQISAGQDLAQDIDMRRQEYFDRLSPEAQKQLREATAANEQAVAANQVVTAVNADLERVNQDFEDIVNARTTASHTLASNASAGEIDAMAIEIRDSKYAEIESLMAKATADQPAEPGLWIYLGRAQVGTKDFLDAETSFKKALDLASKAQAPRPLLVGAAEAGLGEVYARTLMVDEANAAFNAAAKADPANAAKYLRNQAVIFFEEKNSEAQIDAADEALKADSNDALLYFIKAQGMAMNAPVDPDSNKIVLSPDCLAAFRKYLELAPSGQHAADVKAILQKAATQTSSTSPPPQQ